MTTSTATAQKQPLNKTAYFFIGLFIILSLTVLVSQLDTWIADWFKDQDVSKNPFEYPLTAVIIGLFANFVLRATNLYEKLRPAIRTELYLKIGLVLLGAKISFGDLMAKGSVGLIQALIMVTAVFSFTWWLAGRMKLPPTLKAVMASAVSICGVSAAIAAAGAVVARKEEVTYISTLVILTALPLMVIMPWVADGLGLSGEVAGAWFGGNIDTTAAVVGAGTIHGPDAQIVAAVVKQAQNVMIGFVSFALALYFVMVVNQTEDGKPAQRPTIGMIWERFPKFVLGFVLVSILASTKVFSPELIKEMEKAYQWWFALAFVCIGIDFSVKELGKSGWRPIIVYLSATVFNTVLALGVAYLLFS